MYIKNKKINFSIINERTREKLDKISNMILDSSENKSLECDYCFFKYPKEKRIGLRAMTTANCGCCDKEIQFTSTVIDVVCFDCAKRNNICVHCGCDRNLSLRFEK